MPLKKRITFRRALSLATDLAPAFEREHGVVGDATHFGRGVRGEDEREYIFDGERLYEVCSPEGPQVSFRVVEDGPVKTDVLADLAEQIRIVDHTPGYDYYTPPGAEPELVPERYWRNKPQLVLHMPGKVTSKGNEITIDTSPDEDQN